MKYKDKHGDVWIRVSEHHVKRLKDNNIGLWWDGQGLKELFNG